MKLTEESLKEVYAAFAEDLPKEALRTINGYSEGDTISMYGYQFVVNRLNEAVGLESWNLTEDKEDRIVEQKGILYYSTVRMTLRLGSWSSGVFVPISERSSFGSGVHELRANSLKSAMTNSFKKAAAMFGIGKRAFEGLIEDFDLAETTVGKTEVKQTSIVAGMPVTPELDELQKEILKIKTPETLKEVYDTYTKLKAEGTLLPEHVDYLDQVFDKLSKKKFRPRKK